MKIFVLLRGPEFEFISAFTSEEKADNFKNETLRFEEVEYKAGRCHFMGDEFIIMCVELDPTHQGNEPQIEDSNTNKDWDDSRLNHGDF